jgi:hypothetical protein
LDRSKNFRRDFVIGKKKLRWNDPEKPQLPSMEVPEADTVRERVSLSLVSETPWPLTMTRDMLAGGSLVLGFP